MLRVGDPVAGSDQSACRSRWPTSLHGRAEGPMLSGPSDPGRIPVDPIGSVEARLPPLARQGGRPADVVRISPGRKATACSPAHRAAGGETHP
jgi:hypothetical protein